MTDARVLVERRERVRVKAGEEVKKSPSSKRKVAVRVHGEADLAKHLYTTIKTPRSPHMASYCIRENVSPSWERYCANSRITLARPTHASRPRSHDAAACRAIAMNSASVHTSAPAFCAASTFWPPGRTPATSTSQRALGLFGTYDAKQGKGQLLIQEPLFWPTRL